MHAELRAAEMSYLENQKAAEDAACQAEMWAVKAKHDFKRCKRLQRWIDSEQESIDREDQSAFQAMADQCLTAFAELEKVIAQSEAENRAKQEAAQKTQMSDAEFEKMAATFHKPTSAQQQAAATKAGAEHKQDGLGHLFGGPIFGKK